MHKHDRLLVSQKGECQVHNVLEEYITPLHTDKNGCSLQLTGTSFKCQWSQNVLSVEKI